MKKQHHILLLLAVFTLIFSITLYPQLPDTVPSHWGITGVVDGYAPKLGHVILFTTLAIGMPLLLMFIPRLDPKYESIKKFEDAYLWFIVTFTLFTVGLYTYTTAIALGAPLPIDWFIIPGIALLFIHIGRLLHASTPNYTIGIRTAWTLSSKENWERTHQFGGNLFTWGGVFSLVSIFFGKYSFAIFFGVILIAALAPIIYSYRLYRQESKTKKQST